MHFNNFYYKIMLLIKDFKLKALSLLNLNKILFIKDLYIRFNIKVIY